MASSNDLPLQQIQTALSEIGRSARFLDSHFQASRAHVMFREPDEGLHELRSWSSKLRELLPYRISRSRLERSLDAILSDTFRGFAYQLRHNGVVKLSKKQGLARNIADGIEQWEIATRAHVASVSKFVTAMVMLKVLEEHGVPRTAKISPYLPGYWHQGPNVDRITFENLLNHTSGLTSAYATNDNHDFVSAREAVSSGAQVGSFNAALGRKFLYLNVNYVLCRILLGTLTGAIDKNYVPVIRNPADPVIAMTPSLSFSPLRQKDVAWDWRTIEVYQEAVARLVFRPAGIAVRDFAQGDASYSYASANDLEPGWQSGDLAIRCASIGWRFSVSEMTRIAGFFRRDRRLFGKRKAQAMLDAGIGVDPDLARNTDMGFLVGKGGMWPNEDWLEHACVFLIPRGWEFAFAANSPRRVDGMIADGGTVAHLIADAIRDSVVFGI